MAEQTPPKRCRLVLIAPAKLGSRRSGARSCAPPLMGRRRRLAYPACLRSSMKPHSRICGELSRAYRAGKGRCRRSFPATRALPPASRADGVHMEAGRAALRRCHRQAAQDKMVVGVGGIKTRDEALDLGEARPDYVFFGRFNYDNTPEPHPRNLGLARWWAEIIEIPCILLGGSHINSVVTRRLRRERISWPCRRRFSAKTPTPANRSPKPMRCLTKKRRVSRVKRSSCLFAQPPLPVSHLP